MFSAFAMSQLPGEKTFVLVLQEPSPAWVHWASCWGVFVLTWGTHSQRPENSAFGELLCYFPTVCPKVYSMKILVFFSLLSSAGFHSQMFENQYPPAPLFLKEIHNLLRNITVGDPLCKLGFPSVFHHWSLFYPHEQWMDTIGKCRSVVRKEVCEFFSMAICLEEVHIATLVYFDSTTMRFHSLPKAKCPELLHLVRINTVKYFV